MKMGKKKATHSKSHPLNVMGTRGLGHKGGRANHNQKSNLNRLKEKAESVHTKRGKRRCGWWGSGKIREGGQEKEESISGENARTRWKGADQSSKKTHNCSA